MRRTMRCHEKMAHNTLCMKSLRRREFLCICDRQISKRPLERSIDSHMSISIYIERGLKREMIPISTLNIE